MQLDSVSFIPISYIIIYIIMLEQMKGQRSLFVQKAVMVVIFEHGNGGKLKIEISNISHNPQSSELKAHCFEQSCQVKYDTPAS